MASTVLADPTRALQGTNRGSGSAMVGSENDVGSREQLLLYADDHYLAGKLPLGDHLGKAMAPRPLHQLCGQCDVEQWELYRSPGRLRSRTRLSSVSKQIGIHHLTQPFANLWHSTLIWLGTTVDAVAGVPVLMGVHGKGA
ncbi:15-hydroxyprostaglandin dehydrogenase [Trichonephila clavipes]|nr:15-hydroxyprostaglandin dehydrogenase [Trichonephila clavipes]